MLRDFGRKAHLASCKEYIRPLGSTMCLCTSNKCRRFGFLYGPKFRQKVIQDAREHDPLAAGCAVASVSSSNGSPAASWCGQIPCSEVAAGMLIWLVARRYVRPSGSTMCRHVSNRCRRSAYLFPLNVRKKVNQEARKDQKLATGCALASAPFFI